MCSLSQDGELLLHRTLQTTPETFVQASAPSREGLVVAVAGMFTWDWLAARCADEGLPFVLGHAP
jgi:hypothetical protein